MQDLFGLVSTGKLLAEYCERHKANLEREVRYWDSDEFLATPDREITDYLTATHSVACPVLRQDEATVTEPEPVDMHARSPMPAYGQLPYSVPGSKRTFVIPYDGDEEVFYRRPGSIRHTRLPEVTIKPGEVHVIWQRADRDKPDPDEINAYVAEQVRLLQFYLDQSAAHLEQFNRGLASLATSLVGDRKSRMETDREVSGKLLYPLKRRSDAAQYPTLKRRPLGVRQRPTGTRGQGEPWLGDDAFEDVLEVLQYSRNALERSLSLTAVLSEEQIRLILLVNLNVPFEGLAGGEVFNHKGKTDILIRMQDTNIFVCECKIWSGQSDLTEAIDQLLGNLTWRDTKGSLVLFIRNLDVTAVIRKAVEAIEAHPNYVATLPAKDASDRHDFVLHAIGDPEKKLRMAFLPFALGPAKAK
jgi:hypothetical protein